MLLWIACNDFSATVPPDMGAVRPAPPIPVLSAGAPSAGALWTVTVTGAEAGATLVLVGNDGAVGDGACPVVLDGLCGDLVAPVEIAGRRTADADGVARFSVRIPTGKLAGAALSWQVAAVGPTGAALSETLETTVVDPEPHPLAGSWRDDWGTQHHIHALLWEDGWGNAFWVSERDDEGRTLVARNDRRNAFFPALWSRFDWTEDETGTRYCQAAFDAASPEAASAEPASDPSDLDAGCDGFPWTGLAAEPAPLVGSWTDSWGTAHIVTDTAWTDGFGNSFDIVDTNVLGGWLVAQNGLDNAWFPGLWSRFDWTEPADGGLYYCQIAYAEDSEMQARVDDRADPTDLGAGCAGFSWTNLAP